MNFPFGSFHGAGRAGADPATRLNADKASTIFFIHPSLGTGSANDRLIGKNGKWRRLQTGRERSVGVGAHSNFVSSAQRTCSPGARAPLRGILRRLVRRA